MRKDPKAIQPMLAKLANKPFNSEDWIFEIKWDGYRAIAEISRRNVKLYSRRNISFEKTFNPVVQALKKLKHQAILDGEIVVLDNNGRPKFQLLQNYQNSGIGHLNYFVFDLLELNGQNLRNKPLLERKKILQDIIKKLPESAAGIIKFSGHAENYGIDFFKAAQEQNLEGIMVKQKLSPYREGIRSSEWLKIKIHMQQEAVIGGFTQPRRSRKHLGALILGVYDDDKKLHYIGHTGGGFNEQNLKAIYKRLEALKQPHSPFSEKFKTNEKANWVKPELVCEVEFREWTDEGHMRQPIFLGIREDKNAREVKRESTIKLKDMPMKKSEQNELELSNLDKIFWPKEKHTKGDVVEYYRSVSKYILPYLKDRPESLNRHPDGIEGKSFYQKDLNGQAPKWLQTKTVYSESEDRDIKYMLCQNEKDLLYMANLGCIEINPWSSHIKKLDYPDYAIMDLDPQNIAFDKVVEAALAIKKILDAADVKNFCKTSGATGLHIYIPLGAKYNYDQARDFTHLIAIMANKLLPKTTSTERNPNKRKGKIYLDYLQNRRGQTLASAYSIRPRPKAPVSTPLKWVEVKKGLDPSKFTIINTTARIKKYGDLWKGTLGPGIDMQKALKKLSAK